MLDKLCHVNGKIHTQEKVSNKKQLLSATSLSTTIKIHCIYSDCKCKKHLLQIVKVFGCRQNILEEDIDLKYLMLKSLYREELSNAFFFSPLQLHLHMVGK